MLISILLLAIVILITTSLLLVLYRDKAINLRDEVLEENEAILDKYGEIIDVDQETINRKKQLRDLIFRSENQASEIIDKANKNAEEIAGEAYKIKGKADQYKAILKATINSINGYGDEYLIPNHDTLDELAEEYSYKEAGEELKKARAESRRIIKDGLAAVSGYKQVEMQQIMCQFVIDAFNSKIEHIMSKVKSDNYGKLKQQILDAFMLVNKNSEALKNTRVTDVYYAARVKELKWAVAVHELRNIEKEEQRQIKQEMREEEKARKEIEKALKEAEKQEKLIEDAMQKAREEMEAASIEQKEKYQKQLEELENKLKEAEEKNQRALSMAQQTRRGHVYVISNIGSFGENVYKIGLTRRLEPLDRVKELGDASVPFSFDVHALIYSEDAPALEKSLHDRFDINRVNKVNNRKEFFTTSLGEIRTAISELGLETKWTMKAEAQEYRESINIAKEEVHKAG